MEAPTFLGVLLAAFGTGMSLTGRGAVVGIPIVFVGLVLVVFGRFRGRFKRPVES